MKPVWIALLICAAQLGFGQSLLQQTPSPQVQQPGSQQPLFQMPSQLAPQPRIFKLQPMPKTAPQILLQAPRSTMKTPQIDPRILHRPDPNTFQQQEPRVPMAHNIYPDLKLLPVESARVEPIPIAWPGFRMEPIPTTWPQANVVPAEKDPKPAAKSPAKR
jgi:hypothetical protein